MKYLQSFSTINIEDVDQEGELIKVQGVKNEVQVINTISDLKILGNMNTINIFQSNLKIHVTGNSNTFNVKDSVL